MQSTEPEILYSTFDPSKTAPMLSYLDACFPIWARYGWCIGWCDRSRDFSLWRKSDAHSREFREDFDLAAEGGRIDEAIVLGLRKIVGAAINYRRLHPGKQSIDHGWIQTPFRIDHGAVCHALERFMRALPGCWWQFRRESNGDICMTAGLQPTSPFAAVIDEQPDLFGRNSHEVVVPYHPQDHAERNEYPVPYWDELQKKCAGERCVDLMIEKLSSDIRRYLPVRPERLSPLGPMTP